MENPVRLRQMNEDGPNARASSLLREERGLGEIPSGRCEELYRQLQERVVSRQRRFAGQVALVGALATLAAVVILTRGSPSTPPAPAPVATPTASPSHRLALGTIGEVELSASTDASAFSVAEAADERQLRLESGTLRAWIQKQDVSRPVVVVTPHVRVVVVGTSFDVSVEPARTRVEVIDGLVRVEAATRSVLLAAGESIGSDDARLQPLPPTPAAPAPAPAAATRPAASAAATRAAESRLPSSVAGCAGLDRFSTRKACLEQLAAGDGLAAQNALLELGKLSRDFERSPLQAIEYWRRYQARFPSGVLAPEAELGIFGALLESGRTREALESAAQFERRFRDDPRAPEVALRSAELRCADQARHADGLAALERLASGTGPVNERARRAASQCRRVDDPSRSETQPGGD